MRLLLVLIFLMSSCTTIRFSAGDLVPVYVSNVGHSEKVTIEESYDFYLWGLLPGEEVMILDKKVYDFSMNAGSFVTIEESQTFFGVMMMVATFGMYVPMNYKVTFMGVKIEDL